MILIIISVILTIITMFILGFNIDCDKETIAWEIKPKILFGLLWLLLLLFGCFSTIKSGEVGIITRFGKIIDTTKNEGLVFKLPIDNMTKINIKVQKYENSTPLSTSTKDMQVVNNIKVSINYRLDKDKVIDLYKKVGIDYNTNVLEPSIQETVKAVISKYTAEELVTKRSEISLDMNDTLDERIKGYGINSVAVSINNFDFSAAYNEAIEKKAVAEQEVETSKNQLEKAKIDAEKKKVEAQGEADANALLEESLTDEIIMQKFIEKWNGELPKVTSSDNIFDVSSLLN